MLEIGASLVRCYPVQEPSRHSSRVLAHKVLSEARSNLGSFVPPLPQCPLYEEFRDEIAQVPSRVEDATVIKIYCRQAIMVYKDVLRVKIAVD